MKTKLIHWERSLYTALFIYGSFMGIRQIVSGDFLSGFCLIYSVFTLEAYEFLNEKGIIKFTPYIISFGLLVLTMFLTWGDIHDSEIWVYICLILAGLLKPIIGLFNLSI